MKKPLLLLFTLLLSFSVGYSQSAPPAYMAGEELREWLRRNWYEGLHTELGYSASREFMYSYIDKKEDGRVYGVYTGYSQPAEMTTFPDPINAEHTIPQSFFSEAEPMRSDIHHLYPTHKDVNAERGNYPFAEIPDVDTDLWYTVGAENTYFTTTTIPSAEVIDNYSEKDGNVFEPKEDHKGDLARSVFYFFTMYPEAAGNISRLVDKGNVQLLYQWHLQDPVSEWERQRNQRIAEKQGNLNPYVSYPEIACRAWNLNCSNSNITIRSNLSIFAETPSGEASVAQAYTVEANSLSSNFIIQSTPDFQVSLTDEDAQFTDSLNIEVTDGTLPLTTVYVRFTPGHAAGKLMKGGIYHYSGNAQANFSVEGLEGNPDTNDGVLLTEDFNDCNFQSRGWTAISNSSNKDWACLTYGRNGSGAPEMNGYKGDVASDDWLLSPSISLSEVEGAELSFWTRSHYAGNGQQLEVFLTTAYTGDVNSTEWTLLDVDLPQAGSQEWTLSEVDISPFIGEEVVVAFRYEAADNYPSWTVDDFSVMATEAPDHFTASFVKSDTLLAEQQGEVMVNVYLDHKTATALTVPLHVEGDTVMALEVTTFPAVNEEGIIEIDFAPGDSVKTISISLRKNDAIADTAVIRLRVEPTYYVSTGENSSFSITVPADAEEETPEPEPEPEPTGINEEFADRLRIFPNPATSTIQIKGIERSFKYSVRSTDGKLLAEGTYDFSSGIAVDGLERGIYLLQLETLDLLLTRLIMINR